MTDAKTLDARIRTGAMKEKQKLLENAIGILMNFRAAGNERPFSWTTFRLNPDKPHDPITNPDIEIGRALKLAGKQYLIDLKDNIGDAAVQEFMGTVERLSTEVGELRNMVEDLPNVGP